MKNRIVRFALAHQAVVTVALLAVLLTNLTVIGRIDPPDASSASDLPFAGRCQGGGPGCAEQPLIPPPVGGLPSIETPPAPVYTLVLAEPVAQPTVVEAAVAGVDRPPESNTLV